MAHRSVGARSRFLLPTSNCAIRRARNRPHPILSVSDYVFLEHWFPPATEYTKAIRVFVTRKRLMGHRLRDGAIDVACADSNSDGLEYFFDEERFQTEACSACRPVRTDFGLQVR